MLRLIVVMTNRCLKLRPNSVWEPALVFPILKHMGDMPSMDLHFC